MSKLSRKVIHFEFDKTYQEIKQNLKRRTIKD